MLEIDDFTYNRLTGEIHAHAHIADGYHGYVKKAYLEYYPHRIGAHEISPKAIEIYDRGEDFMSSFDATVAINSSAFRNLGITTFEGAMFFLKVVYLVQDNETYEQRTYTAETYLYDSSYLKSLGLAYIAGYAYAISKKDCEVPVNFEQFVLAWNAFHMAEDLGDMELMVKLWKRFFPVMESVVSIGSPCNCG